MALLQYWRSEPLTLEADFEASFSLAVLRWGCRLLGNGFVASFEVLADALAVQCSGDAPRRYSVPIFEAGDNKLCVIHA
jgi:hypothetical protein